ncbi:MAG: tetratricopeptide repeat protein [Candidatus Omnitrophica bacterium]|nr:tetratricopeptide repeat protein [Candidatus Omnitrophota bacterium]
MKKFIGIIVMVGMITGSVLLTGCGKKEEAPKVASDSNAHRLLVEGTVYLKQGEVVKAVENFASAIKDSPDYFEAYFMLAQTFIHLKQFAQAQSVLSAAAQRFPDNPTVYYFLSIAYQGSDDLMPAIVSARKSVDLFRAKKDEEGEKRATILLGVLVQIAKKKSEDNMVENAANAAKAAVQSTPAVQQ